MAIQMPELRPLTSGELNYLEQQGQRHATFRLETMELLNKRAQTVVTLALGGGGALCAFALGKTMPAPAFHGVLSAGIWLFIVALYTVTYCLRSAEVRPPATEPDSLLSALRAWDVYIRDVEFDPAMSPSAALLTSGGPEVALAKLREGEINQLGKTVDLLAAVNNAKGRRLDEAYLLAIITPVVSALCAGIIALGK